MSILTTDRINFTFLQATNEFEKVLEKYEAVYASLNQGRCARTKTAP
jgi:hypothetical protein